MQSNFDAFTVERFSENSKTMNLLRKHILQLAVTGALHPVDDWHERKLEELSTSPIVDGDWIESKDQDPGGEVRLIQLADIGEGFFKDKSQRFVNKETFERLNCTLLEKDDVLIARLPDPMGRACLFPELSQKCITVVDVAILKADRSIILPEYLVMLMNSPAMSHKVVEQSAGTTRQRVATGKLKKLTVLIPSSVDDQQVIINKYKELLIFLNQLSSLQLTRDQSASSARRSAIDSFSSAQSPEELKIAWERIRHNWEVVAGTPESIASLRNLIRELAVRGLITNLDHNFPSESEDSLEVPFLIPNSWRWVKLVEVIDFFNGFAFRSDEYVSNGVGVVRMSDMKSGVIVKDHMKFVSIDRLRILAETFQVKPGDIVMGMTGATLGKPCVNRTTETFLLNQRIGKFIPKGIDPDYLLLVLEHLERSFMSLSFGTGVNNLSTQQIKNSWIPLPPAKEQTQIVSMVSDLFSICDRLESSLITSQEISEKYARSVTSGSMQMS